MFTKQRLILVVAACMATSIAVGPAALQAGQTITPGGLVSFYQVQRAVSPIVVDGKLDEFAWQQAEQINGFTRILNDYGKVSHPTRAKMLWDDEYFYFGFACQDPDIWAIHTERNDPLWNEEVVEVFIDPNGDGRNYLELEVNPLNVVVDLKIHQVQPEFHGDPGWNIEGLQTAVHVMGTVNDSLSQDVGWTVEIAIPWSAMEGHIDGGGRPQTGDTWRLNLYRIERKGGRRLKQQLDRLEAEIGPLRAQRAQLLRDSGVEEAAQLSRAQRRRFEQLQEQLAPLEAELKPLQDHYNEQTEYTAWSETYQRGFHHPARFGVVQFIE